MTSPLCSMLFNIGTIVSGDIDRPVLEGDAIVVKEGLIQEIGFKKHLKEKYEVELWIDVNGTTVTPGLIDSHVHPVIGDFTPRQSALDFLESLVHGGVTTVISTGEAHTPGRPSDPAGVKALAILAHKSFQKFRPNGLKVHAGALILEKGLVEEDFKELAEHGVWLVGEIGLGSIKDPQEATPMARWAEKYGMKVAMHTGGTSIPGSSTVTADMVMRVKPTVSSHTNGGPTSIPLSEIDKLIDESDVPLEIVQCGNMKSADHIARRLAAKNELHRLIIGNDAPSGTGIIPLGILRTINQLSALAGIPPEVAIACASGNTAKLYDINTSIIAPGKEADFVVMDTPLGSSGSDALSAIACGDIPGISLVMIDGEIRVNKSRNTPPAVRQCKITTMQTLR